MFMKMKYQTILLIISMMKIQNKLAEDGAHDAHTVTRTIGFQDRSQTSPRFIFQF
jgi:hypothetical protein